VADKDLTKVRGPAKPTQPGLRIGTKTTEVKAPTLEPRWGAKSADKTPTASTSARITSGVLTPKRPPTGWVNTGLSSERTRAKMVDRLMQQGIRNAKVLDAMRQVPRHQFVDEALASRAYEDTALPIGHHQTISQPFVVARVIELALSQIAGLGRPSKALEVGCGCGYQAAVMSHCFDQVVSVERIRALADLARMNLRNIRQSNLKLIYGDGLVAAVDHGPFDVILCSAGMLSVPAELLGQLAVGGVLVAPVGEPEQHLTMVRRRADDEFDSQAFDMVRYVPVLRGTE
jgi:protein-L-isoaspartate(D-aspartate) O-methyltransferase